MSCLALSLQPTNGPDILLQTREWFPISRALVALSSFRLTRAAFSGKQTPSHDLDTSLGDDPLAASSGQVIVGIESQYRVVYRLVNGIYVLGICTVDHDALVSNVFECIGIVNQAVSVIVAACRGVDVTHEKLARKYAEVYMALDIVLRGVSNIRLAAMLSSIHGDSIAKMVHSSVDTENKFRGAETWSSLQFHSLDRQSSVQSFSNARFELPPETLSAGDEFSSSVSDHKQHRNPPDAKQIEDAPIEKDPFAASDVVNKPNELVSGFKKNQDPSVSDLTSVLAGLDVTSLPQAVATQPTFIGVEGFEGDYGGIQFNVNDEASLNETFEGLNDAFGGGLDVSEFVDPKKPVKSSGLGGLEFLQTSQPHPESAYAQSSPALESLFANKVEMKGPEMYISEVVSLEFRESLLARVGLMGVIYLKTLPKNVSGEDKETEFSFRIEGVSGVKRLAMQSSRISSLGNGMFHVRTQPSDEPIPIVKYSLLPRSTPIPLRVRLVKYHIGTLLSVMIQYVSNPELPAPLKDVTFILKLPVDPSLLKVSPKAVLNRSEGVLKWHVQEIPIKGSPGRLRARMPVDYNGEDGDEIEVSGFVKFSMQGGCSLSNISLCPAAEGKTDFYEVNHRYESGIYVCN